MLIIDVMLNGKCYRIPNDVMEEHHPELIPIRKGVQEKFKEVEETFPNNETIVTVNEDSSICYVGRPIGSIEISKVLRKTIDTQFLKNA